MRILILKVDFEKVYDLVSLSFLDYILGKFGFYEWWRGGFEHMCVIREFAVMVNGFPPP